ncbi:MAG: LptF/LptG family permease [Candidatus Omnitrophica bacterium]|nr:LptF/LptG family permease [Candidatus Omnitrophota bacterium]
MRILDKYITRNIIVVFLLTVIIFTLLYVLIDVTSNLDDFLTQKVPVKIIVQYYLAYIPMILVQTSTIACLISVLVTFGGMCNSNEIIVMRTSGLSYWQITKSALCFGLIISAVVFYLNERFVPKSYQTTKQIKNDNMILESDKIRKKKEKVSNVTFYGLRNRLYYVSTLDPNTNELYGITIIEYDDNVNIQQKIVALEGKWTGIAWKFYKCQITTYGPGGINEPIKVKVYNEKLMDIQEGPEDFMRQRVKVSSMNIRELKDYIDRFSSSGATKAITNLRVDLHHKIAFPLGNFVVVFLGLPFAIKSKNRKGMTFTSVYIAMAISFSFFVISALALAFGKGGLLPPIMSAWIVPVTFIGIGLIVIDYNFGK